MSRTKTNTLPKNVRTIEGVLAQGVAERSRYRIAGERGLHLDMHPSGKATWVVQFQVGKGHGARRRFSRAIGEAPLISLAEASRTCQALRLAAERGEDPDATEAKRGTFAELFQRWLDTYAKKHKRSWAEDERRYRLHLLHELGDEPVSEITRAMLIERLHAVANNAGPIQSNRVGALLSVVFNWALDHELVEQTPAFRLPKLGKERAKERYLSDSEISAFWHGLDKLQLTPELKIALRLMLVTGQRRKEVMVARKADLDFSRDTPIWTIPTPASKNDNAHRVPLPPLALSLMKEAMALSGSSPFLFPSPLSPKAHMLETAPTRAMVRHWKAFGWAERAGPHDLRRTMATNMARLGVPRADAERVLNHVKGAKSSTFGKHYDQHSYDKEKHAALLTWERELRKIVGLPSEGNVVAGPWQKARA